MRPSEDQRKVPCKSIGTTARKHLEWVFQLAARTKRDNDITDDIKAQGNRSEK